MWVIFTYVQKWFSVSVLISFDVINIIGSQPLSDLQVVFILSFLHYNYIYFTNFDEDTNCRTYRECYTSLSSVYVFLVWHVKVNILTSSFFQQSLTLPKWSGLREGRSLIHKTEYSILYVLSLEVLYYKQRRQLWII